MAFKKVFVKLHHIKNDNTGEDPGNELEVYGRFDATRLAFNADIGEVVPLASFNLFNRDGDNPIDMDQGNAFIIESSAQLDIFPGEFLQISGHLGEQDDFGPNDPLGGIDKRIRFDQLNPGLVDMPVFQESDQRVSVKMSMTVTPMG